MMLMMKNCITNSKKKIKIANSHSQKPSTSWWCWFIFIYIKRNEVITCVFFFSVGWCVCVYQLKQLRRQEKKPNRLFHIVTIAVAFQDDFWCMTWHGMQYEFGCCCNCFVCAYTCSCTCTYVSRIVCKQTYTNT